MCRLWQTAGIAQDAAARWIYGGGCARVSRGPLDTAGFCTGALIAPRCARQRIAV